MLFPEVFAKNLFDEFLSDAWERRRPADTGRTLSMKTDVREDEHGYELSVELPGYAKEDVTAELKEGYLTICATKQENHDEKDEQGKYIRKERFVGTRKRSFYVGKDVTQEDIKAHFENGILTIDVPKLEAREPEKKLIAIEG